jgi:hypothetical protein
MANGAMRQVDEVHQAERDGQPAGQHEQQHAVGNSVEQDGQHLLGPSWLRIRQSTR